MIGLSFFRRPPSRPAQAFPMGEWTAKLAAVDHWLREQVCPAAWSSDQKKVVIQMLRDGKSSRNVAHFTHLDRQQIIRVSRFVRSANISNLHRNQSGVAAIEFALVSVPLLLLTLGGLKYGYAMHQYNVLSFAVGAAAKCGAEADKTCNDDNAIAGYAATLAGYDDASYEVAHVACGVAVGGQITSNLIANVSFFPPVPISVTSCFPEPKPMAVTDLGVCGVELDGKLRTVKDALNPQWHQPVQGSGVELAQVICSNATGQWLVN